jgi:glycerol kinase
MKYILAIDQGTTGSRAVLYDRRGRAAESAYEEFPQYFPRPGWVEHDPEEIWRSVHHTIQKVLTRVPGSSILAIGIANQRETTVIWDRGTGRPVHNAIVWQCRRTADRCRRLNAERGTAALVRKRTGLPIDAYFSATKAEWILKRMGRRGKNGAGLCFGNTDAWLLWKLTGGKSHATDPTNASRTMLYDIDAKAWDDELCGLFGVPKAILPEVRPSSGEFGRTTEIGRLPAGIPIMGIAGDQQAALFGQAGFRAGAIKNTFGTGCFILMNTGRKRVDSKHGLITTLACGPGGKAAPYALEGSVFVAGAAIQWLRDQLGLLRTADESEALAGAVEDNAGVYFVPAFVGLGAPYWDASARGTIVGLTRGSGRAHLVRAALESQAYSTRDVLEIMRRDSGLKVRELRIDGGAAANGFLCRFLADILRIPVLRPRTIETTSLGAAYLAGLAAGLWKDTAEIERLWAVDEEFVPVMARRRAEALYRGWKAAVARAI